MAPHKDLVAPKKKPAPEYTSIASRKRRQPSCSVASLAALEDEKALEDQFVELFNMSSGSHMTWGKTQNQPIIATRRKGRCKKRHAINMGAGRAVIYGYREDSEEVPNSPQSSILLGFPLEIREKIYGLLLIYRKSIIIKSAYFLICWNHLTQD